MLNHYKTIIVSDVPLGTDGKSLKKLIYFLKKNTCEKLILNGDLIRGWQLRNIRKLHKYQGSFLNTLFKLVEKYDTEIVFITGKDQLVKNNKNLKFGKICFQEELIITSGNSKYFITREDIVSNYFLKYWITKIFSLPCILAVWINRKYNDIRFKNGKPYNSLLKDSGFFKKLENIFLKNCRNILGNLTLKKDCNGMICGNIHTPCILQSGHVKFLNSGYWSETQKPLVESSYGIWNLSGYSETLKADKEAKKYFKIQKRLFQRELTEDKIVMN